jgi:hypothetical protein
VQAIGSARWERTATLDELRRQVATIEALMFACEAPPILITLVEDLYESIDHLQATDRLERRSPSYGHQGSLLDAG